MESLTVQEKRKLYNRSPARMLSERERKRRSYAENPDKARAYTRKNNLVRKYGLTQKEYDYLFQLQDGLCGICGSPASNERYGVLNVDHNHVTGKIRGLLCNSCNRGLGQLKDNVELLRAATSWLEEHDG